MTTTVAVLGDGTMTRKHTVALLDDYKTATPDLRLLIPADDESFSDAVRFAADWALDRGVDLVFFVGSDTSDTPDFEDYGGVLTTEVDDVVDALTSAADSLFLAWNEEEAEDYEALAEESIKAGKQVFDLTDGLFPIVLEQDSPGEASSEPEAAPEPAAATPEPEPVKEPEQAPVVVDEPVKTPRKRAPRKAPEPEVSKEEKVAPFYSAPDEAQNTTAAVVEPVTTKTPIINVAPAAEIDYDLLADTIIDRLVSRLTKS